MTFLRRIVAGPKPTGANLFAGLALGGGCCEALDGTPRQREKAREKMQQHHKRMAKQREAQRKAAFAASIPNPEDVRRWAAKYRKT